MTLFTRTQQHLVAADAALCFPPTLAPRLAIRTDWSFHPVEIPSALSAPSPRDTDADMKIEPRTPTTAAAGEKRRRVNLWTTDEHERFLHGLELYPQGPWRLIADVVGTRTTRQTMTHAQKYRQKIERHQRMNAAMGRLISSVRSPLLFEGVTATKKARARSSPTETPSPSPSPSNPEAATLQHPPFDWNHVQDDPDFYELLASLAPVDGL
jgi:SHAQKYF class myb-like DNA-binding protein